MGDPWEAAVLRSNQGEAFVLLLRLEVQPGELDSALEALHPFCEAMQGQTDIFSHVELGVPVERTKFLNDVRRLTEVSPHA